MPRQRSWLQTKRRLEIYLADEPGGRPVASLTRADIARVLDGVQEEGFAIGANRTLANINTYLRWCVERGLIEASPVDLVRPPSQEVSRERVLADDELVAVWRAAHGAGYPYSDIVRLLILTAQRREEVDGMAWADPMGVTSFSGWSKAKRRRDEASVVTGWRLHDLRRTAAAGMARLGVAPFVVERVLNHATSRCRRSAP